MLPLGHLGIGARLLGIGARPAATFARLPRRPLPAFPVYLGCLLPDLIDKPLYYGLSLATGRHGAALGFFSGTRTVGHTALFCLALLALGFRSPWLRALGLGVATHLLLDNLGDVFGLPAPPESSSLIALLFPLCGVRFPVAPFSSLSEHMWTTASPLSIGGELVGLALLLRAFWLARERRRYPS